MNEILQILLKSGLSENTLSKLSEKTGLDSASISSVVSDIAPIFLKKTDENFQSDKDSSPLMNMIDKSDVYSDDIDETNGNEILGQILSSSHESQTIAEDLSQKLGLDSLAIKNLLPLVAPIILGAFKEKVGDLNNLSSVSSMLTGFLDKDKDGSVVDDLMGMAKKFF